MSALDKEEQQLTEIYLCKVLLLGKPDPFEDRNDLVKITAGCTGTDSSGCPWQDDIRIPQPLTTHSSYIHAPDSLLVAKVKLIFHEQWKRWSTHNIQEHEGTAQFIATS